MKKKDFKFITIFIVKFKKLYFKNFKNFYKCKFFYINIFFNNNKKKKIAYIAIKTIYIKGNKIFYNVILI